MPLYLLDANVLIEADRDYYAIDRVPEFWDWILMHAEQGTVRMPVETFEEALNPKTDIPGLLENWLIEHQDDLVLEEGVDAGLVAYVTESGYANDLSDVEIEKIGRDPFLVAYALIDPNERVVVTTENSKPKRQRANRKLPDVCGDFHVRCCHTFEITRELNFRTDWRSGR